jgi:hypothetical protein
VLLIYEAAAGRPRWDGKSVRPLALPIASLSGLPVITLLRHAPLADVLDQFITDF